jgi:hypothetical protein
MRYLLLAVIAIVLSLFRLQMVGTVEPHPATLIGSYEAIAHVFVGGLGGSAMATKDKLLWAMFWGLCVIEVACAIGARL